MRLDPIVAPALAGLLLCPVALAQRAFLPPPDAALVDVRLEPAADAPRHTLILRNGQIAAIQGATEPLPPGLLRIEGDGALCLPAFVDAWGRHGVIEPEVVLDRDRPLNTQSDVRIDMQLAGRKGLRPGFRAAEALKFDQELLDSYRQAGFGWARLSPGGDLLAGESALVALRDGAARDVLVVEAAGQMGSFEARGNGYPETLMGAFAQFRQFFYDSERAALMAERRRQGLEAPRLPHDPDLEAGGLLLSGERLWFEADDSRDIERALALAKEFDLKLGLLGVAEGFEISPKLADIPLVLDLNWGKEPEDPRESDKDKKKQKDSAEDKESAPETEEGSGEAGEGQSEAADSAAEPSAPASGDAAQAAPAGESAAESEPEPWSYRAPLAQRLEVRLEWERQRDNWRHLVEKGLPVALGTGSRAPKELLAAAREAVEAGLPREAALAALTGGGLKPFWPEAPGAAIAVGAGAELTLWSADPLTEKDAKVRCAVVEGYVWQAPSEDGKDADGKGKDEDKEQAKEEGQAEPKPETVAADAVTPPAPGADQPAVAGAETSADTAVAEASEADGDEEKKDEPRYLPDHPIETDATRQPSLKTGGNVVIRGAWVHTALAPAERADLWIEQGQIRAIGQNLAVPSGVTVLEGGDWHVAPGAIDTHSHMGIARGINEGTYSITADCDMTDVVDAEDLGLYRALAGGTTAIQILHGSANTIGGRSELLKLRGRGKRADEIRLEAGPQGIKFALGENPKRANWGAPGERFPGTRLGVEALLYRAFERAKEYQEEWRLYREAVGRGENPLPPRRDVRLEALEGVLSGRLVVHSHCYRADEILMLLRVSTRFGFKVGTLHHALEAFKVAREIAAYGTGIATFSDWWAYKVEAYEAVPANAALLIEAGAQASIKSDSDELVRHMYHEAAKSVGYAAMDEVAALRLVTLNPAMQLGVADRIGSLEVGKDGDVVVFDGHPLSSRSKVLMTFVEGECVFERRDAFGLERQSAPILATLLQGPAEPAFGPYTAIEGATIHTGGGQVIPGGTLLVSGMRIVALGENIAIPADATRIDARGLHLYPGLIGLGTSLGLAEIGAVRATDDTREMGGDQPDLSVASSINADSAHIGVTRFNGMTRAQSIPRSPGAIAGRSAVVRLAGDTWEEMLYRENDMLHVGFPRQNPEAEGERKERQEASLRGLVQRFEHAQQYGRIVAERAEHGLPPPPYDPRGAALSDYATGKARVALHADDAHTLLAALAFAQRFDLDAVLYGAREAWKVLPALAEAGLPVVYGPVHDLPSDEYAPYDAPYATPALLARAGVPFAIFTNQDENPRNLCYHAGFAQAFGLSAEEALRAVSLYPARILGVEQDLGSLAPGKRADLVLVRGELFEPTSRVERVWIDGRETSMENHQTRLTERFQARLQDPHLPPTTGR